MCNSVNILNSFELYTSNGWMICFYVSYISTKLFKNIVKVNAVKALIPCAGWISGLSLDARKPQDAPLSRLQCHLPRGRSGWGASLSNTRWYFPTKPKGWGPVNYSLSPSKTLQASLRAVLSSGIGSNGYRSNPVKGKLTHWRV